MSEQNVEQITTTTPVEDAPVKAKRTRAPKSERVEHSAAIAQYARMKNVDTTRAGKLFRARLRAQFAVVAKQDPRHYGANGKYKIEANDKRPWGDHSRATLIAIGLAPKK
jgi:hypothetical protein